MAVTRDCQGFIGLGTGGDSPAIGLSDIVNDTSAAIGLDSNNSGKLSLFASQNNPTTLTGSQITIDGTANGHITLTPNGSGTVDITNANIISGSVTLTTLNVGNLELTGNTIESTNTNGHIIISPNGSGTVDIAEVNITGGTIDNTIIGGTTPASGIFTTATGTTSVVASNITLSSGSIKTTNSALTIDTGTGNISLSNDTANTTIAIGTGTGIKSTTIGSIVSSSSTTVQGGSGGLSLGSTVANCPITMNSMAGTINISTDNQATTINIGTNNGNAKAITIGSTNLNSSLSLDSGFSNPIKLNNGFSVNSTGINFNTVQPAFFAYQSTSPTNVTGDGTVYMLALDTTNLNQGSYFNTTTFTFTAPVAGLYQFNAACILSNVATGTTSQFGIVANGVQYNGAYINPTSIATAGSFLGSNMSISVHLVANNTVTFQIMVSGGTKTIGIDGGSNNTYVSGYLIC